MTVPLSVLIPTRNEERNLPRCLDALRMWADEIVVVDSGSTDRTCEIAAAAGATILPFRYTGGWPKKRQWALDRHPWRNEWILLLDADEVVPAPLRREIELAIKRDDVDGFRLRYRIVFLGRELRRGDTELWKLSLFRRGCGRYERRLAGQDERMADMEVHEHVVIDGSVEHLRAAVRHENLNDLHRYIEKHNEYSTWEARVVLEGDDAELPPRLLGDQAQRRRWLKRHFLAVPGSPFLRFVYVYLLRRGFLDGRAGFTYAAFKFIQTCHVKAKVYEQRRRLADEAGRQAP